MNLLSLKSPNDFEQFSSIRQYSSQVQQAIDIGKILFVPDCGGNSTSSVDIYLNVITCLLVGLLLLYCCFTSTVNI